MRRHLITLVLALPLIAAACSGRHRRTAAKIMAECERTRTTAECIPALCWRPMSRAECLRELEFSAERMTHY